MKTRILVGLCIVFSFAACVSPQLRDQFERSLERTEQLEKELAVAQSVAQSLERDARATNATIATLNERLAGGDETARSQLADARQRMAQLQKQIDAARDQASLKQNEFAAVHSNIATLNDAIQKQKDAIAARVSSTAGSLVGTAARSAFGLPPVPPTGEDGQPKEEGTNPAMWLGLAAAATQFFRGRSTNAG